MYALSAVSSSTRTQCSPSGHSHLMVYVEEKGKFDLGFDSVFMNLFLVRMKLTNFSWNSSIHVWMGFAYRFPNHKSKWHRKFLRALRLLLSVLGLVVMYGPGSERRSDHQFPARRYSKAKLENYYCFDFQFQEVRL